MAERLYQKFKLKSGDKCYAPLVRGRHFRLFKKASDAQSHSLAVRERYKRLKAAEAKGSENV